MVLFDLKPSQNQGWTLDRVKAYYLQQIAIQLEELNKSLKEQNFWQDLHRRDMNEIRVRNIALELMTFKQEVITLFEGKESMKFSEFVKKISALKIWGDLSSYKEAFGFTDYLQIRIAGSGYRVWLLNSK